MAQLRSAVSLIYHDVVERGQEGLSGFSGADAARYTLEPARFERHLDAVLEVQRAAGGAVPRCLLHFDDGGASAWTAIAPALERRGLRGYFHVVTARLGQPGFLGASQVVELHRRGHVIGSHSHTHPVPMTALDDRELAAEWRRSVELLSQLLGERCRIGAVPGGFVSRRVVAAAAAAGIEELFTSEPHRHTRWQGGCLVHGRFGVVRATSPGEVAALVAGRLVPRARAWVLWNGKKVLKRVGGRYWFAARRVLLQRRAGGSTGRDRAAETAVTQAASGRAGGAEPASASAERRGVAQRAGGRGERDRPTGDGPAGAL
jgi:peptidoglycan/xylan/chitin deacetylase (PgdA/CDA1 family)